MGFPEKTEGENLCGFMEQWLKDTFPAAHLSSAFAVEQAHRVPTRPPPLGAPPCPLLARLLSSRDRDAILQAARKLPGIKYNNTSISIFPDFSAALQKTRATFMNVKRRLRDLSIQYSMEYLARLRVIHHDKTLFFNSPKEADEWISTLPKSQRC